MTQITWTWRNVLVYAVLVAVTAAVFHRATRHQFVEFDDFTFIIHNPHINRGLTWEGIRWAFVQIDVSLTDEVNLGGDYHPLTWLTHMIDVQLWGLDRSGDHVRTSVLLHLLNIILLCHVLWRMTGMIWRSAFVAALFALHPLHVESAVWVSGRTDVLCTVFWILAMGAYVRYVRSKSRVWYAFTAMWLTLGLLAKPMLVTLPFVLLLMDDWPLRRGTWSRESGAAMEGEGKSLRSLIVEKWPLFVIVIGFALVTLLAKHVLPSTGERRIIHEGVSTLHRLENIPIAYVRYLGKTFRPVDLAAYYPYPPAWQWWQVGGSLAILLVISVIALMTVRRHPWFMFGWCWFLGTLVPVIGIVQWGGQSLADRYTYIPLIGIFIAVTWAVAELARSLRVPPPVTSIASAVVLVALAFVTHAQIRTWRDSQSLFEHAVNVTEHNYFAHNNLAVVYLRQNRLEDAKSQLLSALQAYPNYVEAHNNLAVAYARTGHNDLALKHLHAALALNPDHAMAHYNRGMIFTRMQNHDAAIDAYRQAIALRPDYLDALVQLKDAYVLTGQWDKAIDTTRRAIDIVTRQGPPELLMELHNHLRLYQSHQSNRAGTNAAAP